MDQPEYPRRRQPEALRGEDQRQEALPGLPTIVLDEKEAARFLKALERPAERTVAHLAALRCRL